MARGAGRGSIFIWVHDVLVYELGRRVRQGHLVSDFAEQALLMCVEELDEVLLDCSELALAEDAL